MSDPSAPSGWSSPWPLPNPGDSQGDATGAGLPSPASSWADTRVGEQDAVPLPRVGQTFLDYRVEEELGRGAFGAVYRATDLRLGREVALKLLRQRRARPRERFLREGQLLSRLSHPHLVPIHAAGEAQGRLYQVQALVEGRTLEALAPLPAEDAARVVRDLARAAGHAHAHGVVHRDIKPSNVVIEDGHAFLLDFGVAHVEGRERITLSGEGVGTAAYAAPEQLAGIEGASEVPVDVYGLGATLYAALTGQGPYDHYDEPFLATLQGRPPGVPSELSPQVPRALDEIVARALAREPGDRFPDAGALAEALEAFLARHEERPAGEGARWPALAGLVLLAALGVGGALVLGRGATPAPDDAAARPSASASQAPDAARAREEEVAAQVRHLLEEARGEARAHRSYSAPLAQLRKARRVARGRAELEGEVALAEGDYLRRRGRLRDALEALGKVGEAQGERGRVGAFLAARAHEEQGEGDRARALYERVARGADALARLAAASAALARGAGEDAARLAAAPPAELAAELRGEWLRVRAAGLAKTGALDAAGQALAAARRAAPDDPWVLAASGRQRLGAADPSGLSDLALAVDLTEPEPARAWVRERGLARARLDRESAEAIADLERVGEDAEALLWLGVVKARAQQGATPELETLLRQRRPAAADWRRAWELDAARVEAVLPGLAETEVRAVRGARP